MITKYNEIINQIDLINPVKYSRDRNFIDGSTSRLSSYISRGVISTKYVYSYLINKGYTFNSIQKFVQEMVWREFWQLTWLNKDINRDLRNKQKDVVHFGMPKLVFDYSTKIKAIDHAIKKLYETGYMHNHMRMYVASLITNVAKYHWKTPAKWMYYYLSDADWGSNALSWQWVCGTNSNKKYYANQDNINKFTKSKQHNTILDKTYDDLLNTNGSGIFSDLCKIDFTLKLPKSDIFLNEPQKSICIYNYYNLDPNWRKDQDVHRILLVEPSIFKKYPICNQSMNFMLKLSKNITDIKIFVGEFNELPLNGSKVYFKEHPLNYNLIGFEDQREWICRPPKNFTTFFKHWHYVMKEIAFKKI